MDVKLVEWVFSRQLRMLPIEDSILKYRIGGAKWILLKKTKISTLKREGKCKEKMMRYL